MGAAIKVLGGRSMEEDIGAYYKKRAVILRITDNGVRKNSSRPVAECSGLR